ncbi:MAG: 8-amino-7-oxononanoate synthase [Balneolaceae bacterium]
MPQKDRHSSFIEPLKSREASRQLRTLTPVSLPENSPRSILKIDGKNFLNFCSNDYLGLANHPTLIERSVEYTRKYGTGSSASRLISGSLDIHHQAEEKLASVCRRDAALLFNSGFQANTTILPALTHREDLILADRRSHNSLIQGGLLSRATFRRFRHNDTGHLESLLQNARDKNSTNQIWVVTESLFSMDGDLAPLEEMIGVCKKFDAFFYVDDAHAFGVLGRQGLGLASGMSEIDLVIGTLGKAAGGFGAFALTSNLIYKNLVNFCSGIIYTTSPPPGVVGATEAAIELIPKMEDDRAYLKNLITYTLDSLQKAGFRTGESQTQIIPVLLDNESTALAYADYLYKNNIFLQAIRPPTVQNSRLRITLTTSHSKEQIDNLIDTLKNGSIEN